MGDRGGTATLDARGFRFSQLYPMGDRGGTATLYWGSALHQRLYPMGDRGGTATPGSEWPESNHYTRWEIGGEPQQNSLTHAHSRIIPDGRSGGNRN